MLHSGCFGSKGNVRFHCVISKVPLEYSKLAKMHKLNNLELSEDKFIGNNFTLCEEDPNFINKLLNAGKSLLLREKDLQCI